MDERWILIPGWDDYEVSDRGRVRRLERRVVYSHAGKECVRTLPPRIYRGKQGGRGYLTAHLRHSGREETLFLHQLVLSMFLGEAPEGTECCHINGDKTDNRLANLKWGTRSENIRDAVVHGTHNMTRKTHCPKGHEYSEENTYWSTRNRPNGKTSRSRECKTCHFLRSRKRIKELGLV